MRWFYLLALPMLLIGCATHQEQIPLLVETQGLKSCGLGSLSVEDESAVPDPEYNALFTRYGPGWTGADSTYSVSLPDGRTLWIFSDTFMGKVNPDRSRPADSPLVRNSLVVQQGQELTTLNRLGPGGPSSFFAEPAPDDWYWVYDATVENNKLRIFLLRFTRTGTGSFDFAWVGNALATLSLPSLKLERIDPLPSSSGVSWGAAIMETSAYTYIYGTEDLGAQKYMHLARVRSGRVSQPGAWEYRTDEGWSGTAAASRRLLVGVGNEYSVSKLRGGFMLVTMNTQEAFSRELLAYFSCSPQGPWEARTVLYQTPETGGNVFTYNAHAHPQLTRGGEVLISYNSNSFVFEDVFANADLYRPHFVRVRIPGASPRP